MDARAELTPERLDPEYVVGALVAQAQDSGYVSTAMSAARFRRGLREFAATLIDANQVIGLLGRGCYRSYGKAFDYPGVASLVDGSTMLELCELAVIVERARVDVVRRAERPSVLRGFVRKAFAVQVRARTLSGRRPVQGTCRRSRPREFRPHRRRVSSSPRRARAPGRPGSDDPHEPDLALGARP